MEILNIDNWTYYLGKGYKNLSISQECGKWMIFPKSIDKARKLCVSAVENGIVAEAKHSIVSNGRSYLCCFYIEASNLKRHKQFIQYFRDNNYLPKNKNGNYTNIAYKYDSQTELGLYGSDFHSNIHLNNFIDLSTGEWTADFISKENKLIKKEQKEKEIAKISSEYFGDFSYSDSYYTLTMSYNYTRPLKKEDYFDSSIIIKQMKKLNIDIQTLAELIEVSPSSIRKWLNQKSRPLAWNAIAMCVYLNIDVDDVIKQK